MTVTKYILMAIPMFSGSGNSMAISRRLDVETGEKFKMAATKPDVSTFSRKT
jgi:hypothetical protein